MNSTTNRALVSIVIPSYNHRHFIGQAVDSVLSQTYKHVECIVIDDGSSDDSASYLANQFSSDNRFTLSARENRGAHATINEAIAAAKGEFIGILNSDDVYHPTRIETLVSALRGIEGPSLLISDLEVIDHQGLPLLDSGPAQYYASMAEKASGLPDQAVFLAGNIAMTTSNFFFSRSTLNAVGEFRALRYTHDWDWALRASEIATVKRVRECLMQYRVHGSNTISEPNIWKHIVENSVIFASKLLRAGMDVTAHKTTLQSAAVMAALLKNESFLPIPVLHLLASGRKEEDLIKGVLDQSIEQELKEVHRLAESGLDVLLSTKHILGKIQESQGTYQQAVLQESVKHLGSLARILRAVIKGAKNE